MLTLFRLLELLYDSCSYVSVGSKLITWSDLFGMIKAVIN
jgi:hypothetical protein